MQIVYFFLMFILSEREQHCTLHEADEKKASEGVSAFKLYMIMQLRTFKMSTMAHQKVSHRVLSGLLAGRPFYCQFATFHIAHICNKPDKSNRRNVRFQFFNVLSCKGYAQIYTN